MTKSFALSIGWIFVFVGIMNFFVTSPDTIKVLPAHAILHIVAGLVGVIFRNSYKGYILWVSIIGILLSVLGFAGVKEVTTYFNLPVGFNYFHAVVGITSLLVYFSARNAQTVLKNHTRNPV